MTSSDKPTPFQNWEQIEQATSDIAKLIRRYYVELEDQGFLPGEAMELTIEYQRSLFILGRANDTSEEV